MSNFPYTLFDIQAAGPSNTTGAAASMLAGGSAGQIRNTIQAGWLNAVGTTIIVDCAGTLITAASSQGNGQWSLYFGSNQIWGSTAQLLTASMATWPWTVHMEFTVRTVGATTAATVYGTGYLILGTGANASSIIQFTPQTGSASGGVAGFDSTVANVCDLWFSETVATATMICQQARVVIANPNI